jgi:Fe-Mn family superoxide dismutase
VPSLQNHDQLVENGIPGLLSKEGFKIAYTDYQQLMVDEINAFTSGMDTIRANTRDQCGRDALRYKHSSVEANTVFPGTQLENKESKSLVIELARNPVAAYGFNVASMAYNNHFFFRGIVRNPAPNPMTSPPI